MKQFASIEKLDRSILYAVTKTIIWRFWEAISVVYNGIFALLSALICGEK